MLPRVVFDTNTVVSALVFRSKSLAWLRAPWLASECIPLASRETVSELTRVLAYPKFAASVEELHSALAEYLPFCEIVNVVRTSSVLCRDPSDQKFLDLAESGRADLLITGDTDLLVLAEEVHFTIETPASYRNRVAQCSEEKP